MFMCCFCLLFYTYVCVLFVCVRLCAWVLFCFFVGLVVGEGFQLSANWRLKARGEMRRLPRLRSLPADRKQL